MSIVSMTSCLIQKSHNLQSRGMRQRPQVHTIATMPASCFHSRNSSPASTCRGSFAATCTASQPAGSTAAQRSARSARAGRGSTFRCRGHIMEFSYVKTCSSRLGKFYYTVVTHRSGREVYDIRGRTVCIGKMLERLGAAQHKVSKSANLNRCVYDQVVRIPCHRFCILQTLFTQSMQIQGQSGSRGRRGT